MEKGAAMVGHVLYAIFLLVICCSDIGAQIDICTYYGNTSTVQDGRCDVENNNAECGFDGGDCCLLTCSHGSYYDCGSNGYTCLDPNVTSVEPSICVEPPFICVESPSTLIPCPAELQEWIVDNITQARAFAESARCVGGSFNVTWKGKVVVDETISIFHGTVLNVRGGNADTLIVGDGTTRLFAVSNASLNLRDIVVSHGNAMYGGAVAATIGSRLSFSRVVFGNNTASIGGGALYIADGSIVMVIEDTVFSNNTASEGGVFYITNGSTVSGEGETTFSDNVATSGDGGALYMTTGSSAAWTAAAHFLNNTAQNDGGAMFLADHSNASWNAESNFTSNSAQRNGGALYMKEGSRAVWIAKSHFLSNNAGDDGGALHLWDGSSVYWTAVSQFLGNTAGDVGGALCLWDGCSGVWDATSNFSNNNANKSGGALEIVTNCSAVWTAPSYFSGNSAGAVGGAISLWNDCSGEWDAASFFSHNSASQSGGALRLAFNGSAVWTAPSYFHDNSANNGGAISLWAGCKAKWDATSILSTNTANEKGESFHESERANDASSSDSVFSANSARSDGGAVYAGMDSTVFWGTIAHFIRNRADDGGALSLSGHSNATWNAESNFTANSADRNGGALYMKEGSRAVWTAKSHFLSNNAGDDGGALYLWDGSSVHWTAVSQFLGNTAGDIGGALCLWDGCSGVWDATSNFSNNNANKSGGALEIVTNCSAVWTAPSYFSGNSAGAVGGAISLWNDCSGEWDAASVFSHNSASQSGGALRLALNGSAVWTAPSYFHGNSADNGGAISLWTDCEAKWDAASILSTKTANEKGGSFHVSESSNAASSSDSVFSANSARSDGGAVYASKDSTVFWGITARFINNRAENGGAIFVTDGVIIEWRGKADFISNIAQIDGGAVGSKAFESDLTSTMNGSLIVVGSQESKISLKGDTIFANNTCREKGGGMALVQSLTVLFGSKNTTFMHNSADVSSGAVYLEGIGIGTHFRHVDFVGNVAPSGGGVHATGSGTTATVNNSIQQNNPTTFDGCSFVDNSASATGGAVDSASGQDVFLDTVFKGNRARVGGALRLAGTSSISNCSFNDNISEFGEGPAVHNLGYMSNLTRNHFKGNIFNCESGMFLDFNESDDIFKTVCNGCLDSCTGCIFEEEQQGSPTCTSLSQAGIEHTKSSGGTTTVEQLKIDEGYWRATNTSTLVYECFNTKACGGGVTGALDYCLPGYEGPYCSICSKTHIYGTSFSCRECSDRAIAITIVAILVVLATAIGLATVSYLVSAEVVGRGRGIVEAIVRRVPTQSVKVVIVVWQILTQFTSVANVTFPNGYQRFLEGVNFLNFDLSWVFSIGCFLDIDFHDRLLWTTIAPVVMMGLLGGTYAVALRQYHRSPENVLRDIRHKHVSTALLVTFLVYSSVSSVVFQMFACDALDDKLYLRADYRLECDSPKHRTLQVYAGLMIFLYPVGIPSLYAFVLFSNRHVLRDTQSRMESSVVRSMSDLWKPYKPQRFYYEVIECGRRIMLTGVIVFIYPNTAAQIAVTLAISVVFIFVSEILAPHKSHWDAWINRTGHIVIFASMYVALLLKVDVSGENATSQKTFEVILIVAHGCMILVVVVEAVLMTLSLRAGKHTEDPMPRLRNSSSFRPTIQTSLYEEDEDTKNEFELIEK